jgi:hypothetical protein
VSAVAAEKAVRYADSGVLVNVETKDGRSWSGVRLAFEGLALKVLTGKRGRPPVFYADEVRKVAKA